jgi:hypothetical protein
LSFGCEQIERFSNLSVTQVDPIHKLRKLP